MEFSKCIKFSQDAFWCSSNHPLYTTTTKGACELQILQHNPQLSSKCQIETTSSNGYWTTMYTPNSWIFSVQQPTPVDILCGDVYPLTLNGSGILHLEENCMMRSSELTVIARKTAATHNLHSSILPQFNLKKQLEEREGTLKTLNWWMIGTIISSISGTLICLFVVINKKKQITNHIYDRPTPTTASRMSQHSV